VTFWTRSDRHCDGVSDGVFRCCFAVSCKCLKLERETGFEPATLSLGKRSGVLAADSTASQAVANPHDSGSGEVHSVPLLAPFCRPFAAPVLHDFLTVRQVAARLSVSTATVYKLCATNQLRYVRVLGAIRVAPGALAALLERRPV
jgi:excisionase family DNA binding protein